MNEIPVDLPNDSPVVYFFGNDYYGNIGFTVGKPYEIDGNVFVQIAGETTHAMRVKVLPESSKYKRNRKQIMKYVRYKNGTWFDWFVEFFMLDVITGCAY